MRNFLGAFSREANSRVNSCCDLKDVLCEFQRRCARAKGGASAYRARGIILMKVRESHVEGHVRCLSGRKSAQPGTLEMHPSRAGLCCRRLFRAIAHRWRKERRLWVNFYVCPFVSWKLLVTYFICTSEGNLCDVVTFLKINLQNSQTYQVHLTCKFTLKDSSWVSFEKCCLSFGKSSIDRLEIFLSKLFYKVKLFYFLQLDSFFEPTRASD